MTAQRFPSRACFMVAALAALLSPARAAETRTEAEIAFLAPEAPSPAQGEACVPPSAREKAFQDLELAVRDLIATFGEHYPKGAEYLARVEGLRRSRDAPAAELEALRTEALLANPLLGFGKLLLVQRGERQLGLPANWQANSGLPTAGYDNRIAVLAPVRPDGALTTVFQPEGGRFVGDVDLAWDAGTLLFSMPGTHGRWQVFELALEGGAARELPLILEPDVDNYDACYLPDGRVLFTSTAPFVGVPCVYGSTHVTSAQFACFDPAHESRVEPMHGYQFGIRGWPVDGPAQPVVRVSWDKARAFCEWLSKKTGATVDLPTEAQWEYACRAGTASEFWYGTLATDFAPFANLGDSKLREFAFDTYVQAHLVPNPNRYDDWIPKDDRRNDGGSLSIDAGSYRPNPWGLYDMHGNVWEWTRSAFRPYPYRAGAEGDAAGEYKVVRGGSWYDRPFRCTSSFRLAYRSYQPAFNVRFRIVVAADALTRR